MPLVDNTARVLADLERRLAAKVRAAAGVLVVEHKRALGTRYPPASTPGEYPAKRTGNLQSSVQAVPLDKVSYRVGYSGRAPYVVRLSTYMHRLHLSNSVPGATPKMRAALRK